MAEIKVRIASLLVVIEAPPRAVAQDHIGRGVGNREPGANPARPWRWVRACDKIDPMWRDKVRMPSLDEALPGRAAKIAVPPRHFVLGTPLEPPYPDGTELALFGMGCFWGAEKVFWQLPAVYTTAVGYAGGLTANPTYREVCSGLTGHNEVVRIAFDPRKVPYGELLRVFWEGHDPTQGMRQGNDLGTQYRSGIYTVGELQRREAEATRESYQERLRAAGYGAVTTEIVPAPEFYVAEDYHQQYLAKNPDGYCGHGGTGVTCPVGVTAG